MLYDKTVNCVQDLLLVHDSQKPQTENIAFNDLTIGCRRLGVDIVYISVYIEYIQ